MPYKRKSTARTITTESPSSLVRSWPGMIESLIDCIVGTRGSRYRARIDTINTAILSLQAPLPTASYSLTSEPLSIRHAEDPRVKTIRSWVPVTKWLLPKIKKTISPSYRKIVESIDEDLKRLHGEVRRIRGVNIDLVPTPAPPSPRNRLTREARASSIVEAEASPVVILLEKKKGLFRNPDLFEFELWDDRKARFAATPALGRGPLFPNDLSRITKSSRYRKFSKNNLPQYKREKVKDDRVRVAGGSRLSFGEEIDTAKDKFK